MKYYQRSTLLFFIFNIFILIIFGYIIFLQIFSHKYYIKKSMQNYTRFEGVESIRGIITDENNIPIAITELQINLFWIQKPHALSKEDIILKNFLENFLHINLDAITNKKKINEHILIKENISIEEYVMIIEKFPENKNIFFKQKLKRTYPHKNLFCHIVGYINKDKKSIYGIEKLCEPALIGQDGLKKNMINANGKIMSSLCLLEPKPGSTIKTTLNYKIQLGLEENFPKEFSGCAIVINPNTGAIKGLYSHPTFNPEIFQENITNELWNSLQQNESLINRAIQGLYPPGSIYKLLISLILLEENIIKENSQWFCNGFFEYKNRRYHCNKKAGHGIVTIRDGIAYSCNIPFFITALSQNISIDTVAKYATTFNLGQKNTIFDNGPNGLIPTTSWKKKKFGQPWYLGENLSIFIGQGATTLTPLQMSQLIMGIMQGYIIQPFLLETEHIKKKILPYKKENLQIIRNNMKLGTKYGSSRYVSSLKNWEIYAKTGTVQVCALSKKNSIQNNDNSKNKKQYNHHGIFACWAKYKDEQPMIIIFVIENNNSSRYTVMQVKNFLLYCENNIYNSIEK